MHFEYIIKFDFFIIRCKGQCDEDGTTIKQIGCIPTKVRRSIDRYLHRSQLSSTDFIESKIANIERELILVGYRKPLPFSLFCLFLF